MPDFSNSEAALSGLLTEQPIYPYQIVDAYLDQLSQSASNQEGEQ